MPENTTVGSPHSGGIFGQHMKSQLPHLKAVRASAKRPLGLIAIAARNDRVLCTRVVPN
jgi:hypothetical protein